MLITGTIEQVGYVYSPRANSKTCVLDVSAPPFDPEFGWDHYQFYSEKDLSGLVGKLVEFETEVRVLNTLGGKHKFECVNKFKPC